MKAAVLNQIPGELAIEDVAINKPKYLNLYLDWC